MKLAVIDASVAIKWFLVEEETEEAMDLARALLRRTVQGVVPELFYFEVFSVLVRKHHDPEYWANHGVSWLRNLPLKHVVFHNLPTTRMQYFAAQGLSGYDSAYAALADELNIPWVTFDMKASHILGQPNWIHTPRSAC